MFLKSLKIEKDKEAIREITFHKGLNLIIDETTTVNLQESGNNVGKTTVLRLIDFCLGGNGKNIYKEVEFKDKAYTSIENFLKGNNVVITLILKGDLENPNTDEIEIRKNFHNRNHKVQEINGENYNDIDFDKKLKELVFHTKVEKPTFRQIISKNIRYEKTRLDNTVRVLHQTTTIEEYEALFFFWLGIETDAARRKIKLQSEKGTEEEVIRRLKKESSASEIEQALAVINRDIQEIDFQKESFNLNENYEEDLGKLNLSKSEINRLTTEINRIKVRIDLIVESKANLEKEFADVNISELEQIYKTAESFIPSMHVKFQELVKFHNQMLKERIEFITEDLPRLQHKIVILDNKLRNNLINERKFSEKLKKSGAIDELEEIIQRLNHKYEQKGKYEEQLRQWTKSTKRLNDIEGELRIINEGIASKDKALENRIKEFNKYFSKISEKLYGEQFILSSDKNERAYELKVGSIEGNLGTGKKKGQIAAFDFAYIQFCDENDIPCLHFILHDQIESIHDNQLTLIAEVANETNSQFVAPVLRDKLPFEINPNQYKVISLSQDDKLFRV